ncbi:hypothetical protein D3C73_1283720 [compost metagenome]
MARPKPVTFASDVACIGKQQTRHLSFPDPLTQFTAGLCMEMGQHHRIDILLADTQLRQIFQKSRCLGLTAASSRWWCQKRVNAGQYQNILAVLLHQQPT